MSKKRRIFARFVVHARDDADIWALSDAAFRLYWSGILWCRDKGNDGSIPPSIVAALSPVKKPKAAHDELVATGFWVVVEGMIWIRNYGEYQDTAADIEQRRTASRVANRAQGKGTDPVTDPVTDSGTASGVSRRRAIGSQKL